MGHRDVVILPFCRVHDRQLICFAEVLVFLNAPVQILYCQFVGFPFRTLLCVINN